MNEGSGTYTYDGSGNQNHGTISGATWDTANTDIAQVGLVRQNSPMVFDGSDDYVDCGTSSILNPSVISVSMWVKANTLSNWGYLINRGDDFNGAYRLEIGASNIYANFGNGSSGSSINKAHGISTGSWHHLAWTYDGSTATVYVDGVSKGTESISITMESASHNTTIGKSNPSGGDYFDGLINEVAIWDEALDADAVTALYNSGTPLDATEDSGNYDNSDDLQGYWRNDNDTTWTDRANTGVASLDGTNDCLTINDFTMSGNQATFSFWGKLNSSTGYFIDTTTGVAQRLIIGFNSSQISVYRSEGGTGWKNFGTITTGVWNHFVIVLNNTTASAYVNGSKLGSDETITAIYLNTSAQTTIGANYAEDGSFINGQISGSHIFDVALTSTEVTELYAIDKRSSISGHSQFSNCVGSWLMGAGSGDTTSTIQDQTSENNDATVSGATLVGYNDGTVSDTSVASIVLTEGLTSGRDSQGFFLTDTTENCLTLNGAEYVEIPDSEVLDLLSAGFSVEAWVNIKSLDSFNPIVTQWDSTDNANSSWTLETVGSDLTFYMRDGGSNKGAVSSSTATLNVWRHVVGVFEGDGVSGGLKVYVDGVVGGTTQTITASQQSSFNIFIGEFSDTFQAFNGKIDDVKIYSDALSSDEVTKNYNAGKSKHS